MSKIYEISEIKEKLEPIFSAAPVYRAILFGSYATGEADEKSDIDIVIDSRGELLNIHFYGVLEDIVVALDKKVDMFEVCEIRKDSSMHQAIEQEGIVLYDKAR